MAEWSKALHSSQMDSFAVDYFCAGSNPASRRKCIFFANFLFFFANGTLAERRNDAKNAIVDWNTSTMTRMTVVIGMM